MLSPLFFRTNAMYLDRTRQLEILKELLDVYPQILGNFKKSQSKEIDLVNVWYLHEQGLVEGNLSRSIGGNMHFSSIKITAKGIDFLADDGGISAILGVVTVKLHADTIRQLLLSKIDESDAPPEKKSWIKEKIKDASDSMFNKIVDNLLEEGIKRAPDVYQMLERAIGSVL